MKKSLLILGCVLVFVGVLIAVILPYLFLVEQTYTVGGGELTGLTPNLAFVYLGIGAVIIGALLTVIGFLKG